ncbi:MAG: aliphatic sulfonate ABC transporter substrate-binding protein [Microbacterium sp.]
MRITKKLFGIVAVGAAMALALAGCSPSSDGGSDGDAGGSETKTIDVNFGYIADFNGTSLLAVAKDQGIWEKHGLKVKESPFTNGPLQIQAIGTGDLDFGYIGPGAMWLPASGKAKIVSFNSLGNADRVIAQPGITSMQDLKGKNVAVPEGTSGDMILTLALEKAGMSKSDITLVPMDAAGVVTAFASKQVDAAGIWYPAIATIKKQVPELVELAKNSDFSDTMAFPTAFVANVDVADKDPEMAKRMVAALRDAIQWRSENMDKTIDLTASFLALTPEQVKDDASNGTYPTVEELDAWTADGTIDTWMTSMNDYFIAAGKLAQADALAPSDFYLGSLFTGGAK